MIQQKELRKGNYVLYNTIGSVPLTDFRFENPKELCQVTGLEEDRIAIAFADEQIRKAFDTGVQTDAINLSPVILTQELVEACHFQEGFTITAADNGFTYNHQTVKYLHQLQNIYSDATGKELRVDL